MKNKASVRNFNKKFKVLVSLFMMLGIFCMAGIESVSAAPLPTYKISVASNSTTYGTVSGGGTFNDGSLVTVTAIPNATYRFAGWLEGTTTVSTKSAYQFTVTGNRNLTAQFTQIGTPVLSSAVSGGPDSVQLAWSGVSGASHYLIYRATTATGTYSNVGTATGTSYTNTGLAAGKTYYYRVRACATAGTKVTYGSLSAYKYAKPLPGTPVISAVSAAYNSVKVSWSAISGANGYYVYRATTATGTYAYIGATTGVSLTNSGLVTGRTYFYKVSAYHTEGTTKVFGSFSGYKYAKPIPATPVATVTKLSGNSVRVSWAGISGSDHYQVYRATSATGTYSLVYTGGSTARSFTNSGLTFGQTYYYKVRGYHTEGTALVVSGYSSVKSVKVIRSFNPGTYLVGSAFPAGEYLIVGSGEVQVATDKSGSDASIVAYQDYDINSIYITVTNGQYITISDGTAYHIADAPLVSTPSGNLSANMYKVGRDIPAGDYVLYADGSNDWFGTLERDSDSKQLYESMITWDIILGRSYVTVKDGEYLIFEGSKGYSLAKDPAIDTSSGKLGDGMYKVGKDLPAGTYAVNSVVTGNDGFVLFSRDALHESSSEISTLQFQGQKTITVTDGQYITLFCSELLLIN